MFIDLTAANGTVRQQSQFYYWNAMHLWLRWKYKHEFRGLDGSVDEIRRTKISNSRELMVKD